MRRIIGAARDGLGLRRMGLTVESSPGEGLGRGCGAIIGAARDGTGLTACRARDGVGIAPDGVDCGILKLGWVGMVAYAFAAAAPDSDRARGWDGVAAQSSARRGMGRG